MHANVEGRKYQKSMWGEGRVCITHFKCHKSFKLDSKICGNIFEGKLLIFARNFAELEMQSCFSSPWFPGITYKPCLFMTTFIHCIFFFFQILPCYGQHMLSICHQVTSYICVTCLILSLCAIGDICHQIINSLNFVGLQKQCLEICTIFHVTRPEQGFAYNPLSKQ